MKILVTNDDGLYSEGIKILATWARKLGEVTVVAPRLQQSATSCAIKIHEPFAVRRAEWMDHIPAWTVDSTPADCVRIAQAYLGLEFDLVLSGINRGFNVGADIAYSGTCGAIFEAACCGWPAIAFSTWPEDFEAAAAGLDRVYEYITQHKLLSFAPILNVNIPPEAGPIHWTRQGAPYYKDQYKDIGDHLVQAQGYSAYDGSRDWQYDINCVLNGRISISPLSINRTDEAAYLAGPKE